MLGRLPYLLSGAFFLIVPVYVVLTDQYQGNFVANVLQALASISTLGWPAIFLVVGGVTMLAIGLRHDEDALGTDSLHVEESPPA